MKKMYLAIFLIILVIFVFAGCLSFSGTISTSTTESDEETTYFEADDTTSADVIHSEENTTVATEIPEETTSAVVSPETTTEPEATGAVIENQAPASSEYDILRSGSFHMVGSMVDKTGIDAPMEIALTPDSVYMLSDFSGVPMGMLIKDETVYMIYPDKSAYLELSDSLMSMAGLDIDELVSSDTLNFGSYGDLSGADKVTEVVHDGRTCQVYHFNNESGETRVYMDGTKLVRLASYDLNGQFITSTDIDTISGTVPADKSAPPANFKAYKGMTGMFSFMTLLEGVLE